MSGEKDMDFDFRGVGVALVTPFKGNGEVDFAALERLVESVIGGGVDYLVVLGTTAETPALSSRERTDVASCVRSANAGRKPMIIGVGGNCTASVVRDLKTADTTGFSAVLSVTPYYNKPSQRGLYLHYKAVAEASPLPVVLYNVPGRTGVNIEAATTLSLAYDCPNVVAIKEASGRLEQIKAVLAGAPDGFKVISGDDSLSLPIIGMGGVGVISVAANVFTDRFCRMIHTVLAGDKDTANSIFADLETAISLLFSEGNPTGVKTALAIKGMIEPMLRLPLVCGSELLCGQLTRVIEEKHL